MKMYREYHSILTNFFLYCIAYRERTAHTLHLSRKIKKQAKEQREVTISMILTLNMEEKLSFQGKKEGVIA